MTPRPSRAFGALVLAGSLAAMAACSSDSPDPGSTEGGKSGGSSEPVQIQYLHRLPDGEGMTKVADIVKRWNDDHPEIQVEATKFDGKAAEMITKLEADTKAGTAPCLAQLGYAEVPSMFTKGLLQDVSSEAGAYEDHYSAGAFSLMTVGDKTVGLPQDTGPLVYYYNKKAFDDLGLSVPTTGDELVATAKEAAAKGKYVLAFEPDEAQYWLSAQAAAAGATWYSVEDGKWKVTVNDEASQKVADMWQGLIDEKAVVVENRWGDGFKQALTDQKLIGTIGAAWEAPLLAGDMADTENAGQWAVAQLPQLGSEMMTGPDGGSGVAVMKSCESPKEAMEFNDWFNTQIEDLVSQGLVVAAKGTMETPADIQKFFGDQDVYAELAKANEALNPNFPYIPTYPAVGADMAQAADRAGKGEAKVADVFTAAQKASVSSLKDAGLPVSE